MPHRFLPELKKLFPTIHCQDIMSRYQRMRGRPTLWLPGTDHAGAQLLLWLPPPGATALLLPFAWHRAPPPCSLFASRLVQALPHRWL